MDNKRSKLSDKPELPTKLKLENTMDASGMWFAAAVLFAVLAAGIIIYRAANDDIIRTASNDTLTEAITLPHKQHCQQKAPRRIDHHGRDQHRRRQYDNGGKRRP